MLSIIQFVWANVCPDKLCSDVSVRQSGPVCTCVECSYMMYSTLVRNRVFIRGQYLEVSHAVPNFIDQNPIVLCTLKITPHHPASTVLLFTVSSSVANTYRRGVTWTAPLCLCIYHSVHVVSLLWLPQSSSAGPQDVERCCCCCQMPQGFRVVLIKPFLWASESQSGESDRAEGTVNLWPQLSPVQQYTQNPVIAHPHLHPHNEA